MTLSCLIFDVDGTLADTEEAHRVAFNLAFDRNRVGWSWSRTQYRELLGVSGGRDRLLAYIERSGTPPDEARHLRSLVQVIHADKTKFYTSMLRDGAIELRIGVARLIEEARTAGAALGLTSSSSRASIDSLLAAAFGAKSGAVFKAIVCGADACAKKPSAEGYLLALQRLGAAPARVIAFEDSRHGLDAASGAGIRTVITPNYWTEQEDFSGSWLVLPHLGDPDHPLPGEPGARLHSAAWLTWAELRQRVANEAPARP